MPYTGNPAGSLTDAVRFLIGDTNNDAPYLTDSEILFLLGQYDNNPGRAAIDAVYGIIAQLSSAQDESVGSVSLSNTSALKGFSDLLKLLLRKYASNAPARAYAGGISRAQKIATRANPDRVLPSFSRDDPSGAAVGGGDIVYGGACATGASNYKSLGDWEYSP